MEEILLSSDEISPHQIGRQSTSQVHLLYLRITGSNFRRHAEGVFLSIKFFDFSKNLKNEISLELFFRVIVTFAGFP